MINHAYIHIPFCKKKCKYCAFCSFELTSKKETYLNALKKEVKFLYKNEILKTIYFGGGTPGLLEACEIEDILNLLKFNKNSEITIEINPKEVTLKKLKEYKKIGINRISVGVQSFNDKILKEIGRNHSKKEIFKSIENIAQAGFDNYSIDLIYGLPMQNLKEWEKTLDIALKINPSHISLYGLKIEEGTYYYKNPPKNIATSDIQAKMYELALEKLGKNYLHYEFSNFAKEEKYFSKHNLCYWQNKNYYGFGLSASGYIDNKRYTNTHNFNNYIKNPQEKDFETLTLENKIEEEIFLGLRILDGLDFEHINKKYNINIYKLFSKEFTNHISKGYMEKTKKGVKLTTKGILLSNEILCDYIDINL